MIVKLSGRVRKVHTFVNGFLVRSVWHGKKGVRWRGKAKIEGTRLNVLYFCDGHVERVPAS